MVHGKDDEVDGAEREKGGWEQAERDHHRIIDNFR